MYGACNGNFFFGPPPGALGRGQKVKYHLVSISKIFIPNCVCVLTNERYNISEVIFNCCLAPGMGLRVTGVPRLSKKKNSNTYRVMWHIKLTGMTSRTEC